jgi:hypothetical protein
MKLRSIMAMIYVVEAFDMAQILLLLVRIDLVFSLLLTLTESFISYLPHLSNEGKI